MEKDLTRGKPARVLLRFALPVIGGNLFQLFYTLADSVIVGRTLGADALAAVGSTSIIIYLVLCFIQGFTGGFGICLGQRFGAKDQSGMERSVRISWLLSLFFTVVLTVVCCLLAHPILRWMQTPDAIYADAYDYMFVILLGTGATIFYNMISNMLRALGDSRTPVIFLVVSSLGNVALDVLFIVPMKMGVAGAAIATVIGQIVAGTAACIINLKANTEIHFRIKGFRPDGKIIGLIYEVGIPSIIMQSIGSVMTYGMNKILLGFSSTAAAVFGVYFKLQSFIFMPVFGLNNGMVPIIAYNYGAGKRERMMKTLKLSILYAVILMLIGFLVFQVMPDSLLGLFDASETMLAIGRPALRIISISFLLAGFSVVCGSMFQALGNGVYSMLVSIARQLIVLLPVAYLLSRTGNIDMVWWAYPIAELVSGGLTIFFLVRIYRNVIVHICEPENEIVTR